MERVTGHPELHHSEGRYQWSSIKLVRDYQAPADSSQKEHLTFGVLNCGCDLAIREAELLAAYQPTVLVSSYRAIVRQ